MRKSFCTLSQVIDCDTALTSVYAYTFNVPNAELGFLFFLVVALFSLWALVSKERHDTILSFLVVASSLALLYALYMSYIMFAKLTIICLLCIGSHLLTLAILLIALKVRSIPVWKLPAFLARYVRDSILTPREASAKPRTWQYLIVTATVYAVGLLFFFGLNEQAHSGEPHFDKSALLYHFYAQDPVEVELSGQPMWGQTDAPITIIDFSDFQCPFCRRAAFSLKPFLGEYRNSVRLVYLNYPLDNSCNPNMTHAVHPFACLAAKASLCAHRKGSDQFWQSHDLIFENQRRLSRVYFIEELAPQVGLTGAEMTRCLDSTELDAAILKDIELGQKIGLQGTPSIYINGRYLRGWAEPAVLRAIIAAELKRSQGKPPPEYFRARGKESPKPANAEGSAPPAAPPEAKPATKDQPGKQ